LEHFFISYQHFPLSKNDAKIIAKTPCLQDFQKFLPEWNELEKIIQNKSQNEINFLDIIRKQYSNFTDDNSFEAILNIHNFNKSKKIFTVTCAHQPILFGGPLYVLLKIVDCISICRELNKQYPEHCFLPIFYIGAEDHDSDEISKVSVFNQSLFWEHNHKSASGFWALDEHFNQVKNELFSKLNNTAFGKEIIEIIQQSFNENNYGISYQSFIHKVFGRYGLLTFLPNDDWVKKEMKSIFLDELSQQTSFTIVSASNERLKNCIDIQANPREINLFYSDVSARNRIEKNHHTFNVLNREIQFDADEMPMFIDNNYEKLSPNVILRPLMQEKLLNNILFIGGGAEISYWLQLKKLFEHYHLDFPMLMRRSSVLMIEDNSITKLKKVNIELDFFLENIQKIEQAFIQKNKDAHNDIDAEMQTIKTQLNQIQQKAKNIDESMLSSVEAEMVKVIKSLQGLSSKIEKIEKNKNEISLHQLRNIREKLLPNNILHERKDSWIQYLANYGFEWISYLIEHQNVFKQEVLVVKT